jgi:hypothetical protein
LPHRSAIFRPVAPAAILWDRAANLANSGGDCMRFSGARIALIVMAAALSACSGSSGDKSGIQILGSGDSSTDQAAADSHAWCRGDSHRPDRQDLPIHTQGIKRLRHL